MADWAVDSSVVSKWVLPEPDTALAQRAGNEIRATSGRLIVLDLALIESANAIRTQLRRKTLDLAAARQLCDQLLRLPVHQEPAKRLLSAAFDLATRYELAVDDALFVALAIDQGTNGLTADEPLYRAVHADYPQIHLLRNWPPQPTP